MQKIENIRLDNELCQRLVLEESQNASKIREILGGEDFLYLYDFEEKIRSQQTLNIRQNIEGRRQHRNKENGKELMQINFGSSVVWCRWKRRHALPFGTSENPTRDAETPQIAAAHGYIELSTRPSTDSNIYQGGGGGLSDHDHYSISF